jgi:16S rRNA processing protein RimM
MRNEFLEAGQIVNTHGIQGEVKITPWCDSPEFLLDFDTLYLDERPVKVRSSRVNKGHVLVMLEGVSDINGAMRLKGKIVSVRRDDAPLPAGRYFIADLMGLRCATPPTDGCSAL